MAHFDRQLTKSLTQALERDDMRTQAMRINEMMTVIYLFVQKLKEAKEQIDSRNTLEGEYRKLKRTAEKSDEDNQKMEEIEKDLEEIRKLEIQVQKSRREVQDLEKASRELQIGLSGL